MKYKLEITNSYRERHFAFPLAEYGMQLVQVGGRASIHYNNDTAVLEAEQPYQNFLLLLSKVFFDSSPIRSIIQNAIMLDDELPFERLKLIEEMVLAVIHADDEKLVLLKMFLGEEQSKPKED